MARNSSVIRVSILGDASDLAKALSGAEQRTASFGDKMDRAGSMLTARVTLPLIAAGAAAVKMAGEQQKAEAKVTSTFESMGAASWTTVEALKAQASAFQEVTTFGDEAVLTGQSILLTFGNIQDKMGEGNDIFTRTTQVMLDLSAALDQDLKSSAVQLGKALNDPIAGVTALTRVGVSFTDQQKEQIRTLTESGEILEAQKVILAELERQFGGTAEALAETDAGKVTQAMNDLGDAVEDLGEALGPLISQGAGQLSKAAKGFQELDTETQATIVNMALLAAAAGPIAKVTGKLWGLVTAAMAAVRWLNFAAAFSGVGTAAGSAASAVGLLAGGFWAVGRAAGDSASDTEKMTRAYNQAGAEASGVGLAVRDLLEDQKVAERQTLDTADAMRIYGGRTQGVEEWTRATTGATAALTGALAGNQRQLIDLHTPLADTADGLRDAFDAQRDLVGIAKRFSDETGGDLIDALRDITGWADATADAILRAKAAMEELDGASRDLVGVSPSFRIE